MSSNNATSPSYPFTFHPETRSEVEKRAEERVDFLLSQMPEDLTDEQRVAKWHQLQIEYNDAFDAIPELAWHQQQAFDHPNSLSAQILQMASVRYDWPLLKPLLVQFENRAAKKRSAEQTLQPSLERYEEFLKQDSPMNFDFELTKSQKGALLAWHQVETFRDPDGRAAQFLNILELLVDSKDLDEYNAAYEYLCILKTSKTLRSTWHSKI